MYKRLQVRIYPTKEQVIILENHFSGYRFAYNLCLDYKIKMYEWYKINKSGFDLQNELVDIRHSTPWLKICKAECIRQAALDVDSTFKKFFKGSGFPKFKSKNDKQSFKVSQSICIREQKLYFYKNLIKLKTSFKYKSFLENNKINSCTFIKDKTNKYWVSILIQDNNHVVIPIISNNIIGIDLGLKTFITTSENEIINKLNYHINNEKRIKRLQRKHSKSKKGGNNRSKIQLSINKLHQKISNQKEYFFHQVSNKLLSENQTIIIETLQIQKMMKTKSLAKAISDISWSKFINILEYKAKWNNRNIIKIGTYEPSSKLCSNCNNKKEDLKLSDRIYNCKNCGFTIDRDLNAAINIKQIGINLPEFKLLENHLI